MVADSASVVAPPEALLRPEKAVESEPIPSLAEMLAKAGIAAATTDAESATTQPYADLVRRMGQERHALDALQSYVEDGKEKFADARFAAASSRGGSDCLHATKRRHSALLAPGNRAPSSRCARHYG